MKALKIIFTIVLALGGIWAILGLFARHDYHIERSAEIHAPRELVHEQVSFFRNLKNWSPWHVYDPNLKSSIEGTDGMPGAKYSWVGNEKIGTGYQLMKSITPNRIDIEVDWGWGVSPAYFIVEDMPGKKTKITWAMDMHVAFPWNAFAMLTDVNAFVGEDFENGLINLKRVCEQIAHPKYRGYEVAEVDFPLTHYLGLRQEVAFQDIPAFFEETYPKAMEYAAEAGAGMSGPPSGFFWTFDTTAMKTDMAAVIPLDKELKMKPADSLQVFAIGGKKAVVIEYFGDYSLTAEAHYAIDDYMVEKKLQSIPPAIEEYVTDPGEEPDTAKWLTKIIYFVEPKADSKAVLKKK